MSSSPTQPEGIFMLSLPDSQDHHALPPDVFHTPPEDNPHPSAPLHHFAKDSQLGFQEINVDHSSHGAPTHALDHIRHSNFDQFGGFENDLSDSDQLLLKKSDLSCQHSSGLGQMQVEASGTQKNTHEEESQIECGEKNYAQDGDDPEEIVDHHTLLDVARARGLTFPRPRWWPDDDNFEPKDQ